MKPEYLNALKAGLKGALFPFFAGLILLITQIGQAIIEAAASASVPGEVNVPSFDFVPGALWTLAAAAFIGVVNALIRLVQAAGIPLFTQIFDKVFGAIPVYVPENTGTVIKETGEMIEPGPAEVDHITDNGQADVGLILLIAVAIGVLLCVLKLY